MGTDNSYNGGGTPRVNMVIGAVHLRKFGKFLEDYVDKLDNIRTRMKDGTVDVFGAEPVSVNICGQDAVCIIDVVNTDNKVLNKVITVLAALCLEVRERVAEAQHFYNTLLCFGEEIDGGGTEAITATSKFLPKLQDLANFIERCHIVVGEFLHQLAAIYTLSPNNQIINAADMHFEDIMQHLGDLLVVLVGIDTLIVNLESLQETWALYKRLIPTVQLSESTERKRSLSTAISHIESVVLSGRAFRGALERLSGWRATDSSVAEELQLYVKNMLNSLEARENGLVQDASALFLRTGCVLVLTATVFGLHDKRLLKQTWEVARRIPCVPLAGSCVWNPDEFLIMHIEHLLKVDDKKQAALLPSFRSEFLLQRCKTIEGKLTRFTQEVCTWIIEFDAVLSNESSHVTLEDLKRRSTVLLAGIKLAGSMKRLVRLVVNIHAALGKPMTRRIVISLCGLTELLSAVSHAYISHVFILSESVHHVAEYLAHGALMAVSRAQQRLPTDKTSNRRDLDALSALILAQRALSGPITSRRLLIVRLALSAARGAQARVLRDEEVEDLYAIIQQLDQLTSLLTTVDQICDTSYLYHHRIVLSVYFDHAQTTRVPYVLTSLTDAANVIPQELRREAMRNFEATTMQQLDERILRRTRESIETNLRLQVHAHLQKERNLPEVAALHIHPLRYFDKIISVKADVEAYLDRTFYNLTTVALHDWRSYGEMRALARVQLGLDLVKDSLPCQTLEQGLDVLEVIRNIHVFVAAYQYNMNNQLFVERDSPNKYLNTIGIRHVSNSIRTHGTGIVNTTVNFIYQFLRNKFYIFSQFLFDEQIKSRLMKDALAWRELHTRGEEYYPYERADKFVKGIRKLGMTEGLSYLDQFRILITQIGNAMGYVRLVRSGGMHACSNSLSFMPETEGEFSERCDGLNEATLSAGACLDRVVRSLAANFADGSHYFRMLVDVFAADFRNPKHSHLNNFYMIVPPLTISYVDHMLSGKEKVARRKSGVWTDDGFAMGLAYVLTLLDQHDKFASLRWFTSTRINHRSDRAGGSDSAASLLTAKRLGAHMQEFDLLAFHLNSARIFFKKQSYNKE